MWIRWMAEYAIGNIDKFIVCYGWVAMEIPCFNIPLCEWNHMFGDAH